MSHNGSKKYDRNQRRGNGENYAVDFRDAAERHWEDAEYLSKDSRIANADHLFGLSAESSLKAVMRALGMTLRADGAPTESQYRVHIDLLWEEFVFFADERSGVHYASHLFGHPNPFTDWNVNQRYNHRSGITSAIAKKHWEGARMAKQILEDAILNGDII